MQNNAANVQLGEQYILDEQYILTELDGVYSAVGPFTTVREAKAFASGIEFAGNDDMHILGVVLKNQLLIDARIVTPVFLKNSK